MDTITVAATDHFENVVASLGDFVANGNLMFNLHNGFHQKLMIQTEKKFTLGINFNINVPLRYSKVPGLSTLNSRWGGGDRSPPQ